MSKGRLQVGVGPRTDVCSKPWTRAFSPASKTTTPARSPLPQTGGPGAWAEPTHCAGVHALSFPSHDPEVSCRDRPPIWMKSWVQAGPRGSVGPGQCYRIPLSMVITEEREDPGPHEVTPCFFGGLVRRCSNAGNWSPC